jgi:hypothetical protein
MKFGLSVFGLLALAGACHPVAVPAKPTSTEPGNADAACANPTFAQCPEAHPKGISCADNLRDLASDRLVDLRCIEDAPDLAALRTCHVRCRL